MIRKKKICEGCQKESYIYGHKLCGRCYSKKKREENKYKPQKPAKKQRIKQVSEKQTVKNAEYKKARLEFLETHDVCQVNLPSCLVPYPVHDKSFLQIHHMQGRYGHLLIDKSKFLCVCGFCHEYLTRNSKWAIENGFSISRLGQ